MITAKDIVTAQKRTNYCLCNGVFGYQSDPQSIGYDHLCALAMLEEFKKLLDRSDDWTSLNSGKLKVASIKMAKERFGNAVRKSDPFGQFRVRLRRVTAMAYDGRGRSYPVQIVEPKED